jgi:hypothetical protein
MDDPSTGSLADLHFDDRNANQGTPRGMGSLERSLQRLGLGRSILVDKDNRIIAGNKTAEKAGEQGVAQKVRFIDTDGTELIAVRRTDLSLDDPKARELAVADKRVAELNLEWDPEVMAGLVMEADVNSFFTMDEMQLLLATVGEETERAPYKPELAPTQGAANTSPDDMKKAADDMGSKMSGEQSLAEVVCPHCGKDFEFSL